MKKDFSKKIYERKDKEPFVEVTLSCKEEFYNKIIHYLKSKYLLRISRISKEKFQFEIESSLVATILYDIKYKYPFGYISSTCNEITE